MTSLSVVPDHSDDPPDGLEADRVLGKKVHPFANAFPMMEGEEFDALVEDIRVNGLREFIEVLPGMVIVDGRNRLRACREAEVAPKFKRVGFKDDAELLAYVWSKNVHRRQLTPSQRAMIAVRHHGFLYALTESNRLVRLSNLKRGTKAPPREGSVAPSASTAEAVAKIANVSERTSKDALAVWRSGDAEAIREVESDQNPVSVVAKRIRANLLIAPNVEVPEMARALEVETEKFCTLLDIAAVAQSKERRNTCGVHFATDGDRLTATSTDGRRLMRVEIPACDGKGGGAEDVFIGQSDVTQLQQFFAMRRKFSSGASVLTVGIDNGLWLRGGYGTAWRPSKDVAPPTPEIPPKRERGEFGPAFIDGIDPANLHDLKILAKHGFKDVQISLPDKEGDAIRFDAEDASIGSVIYVVRPRRVRR